MAQTRKCISRKSSRKKSYNTIAAPPRNTLETLHPFLHRPPKIPRSRILPRILFLGLLLALSLLLVLLMFSVVRLFFFNDCLWFNQVSLFIITNFSSPVEPNDKFHLDYLCMVVEGTEARMDGTIQISCTLLTEVTFEAYKNIYLIR